MTAQCVLPGRAKAGHDFALWLQEAIHRAQDLGPIPELFQGTEGYDDIGELLSRGTVAAEIFPRPKCPLPLSREDLRGYRCR